MRSRFFLLAGLPLALVACGGTDNGSSVLEPVTDTAPQRVEVVSTVGVGTVEFVARTVNSYRVATPAGELTLSATGESLETGGTAGSLDPSLTGVARLSVPAVGPGAVSWSVDTSADGLDVVDASTQAWTVALPMSGWAAGGAGLLGALANEPAHAAAGTGGVAVATEDEVWWYSSDLGQPPYVVADLPQSVAGMAAGHIDRDGILDLAVWSGNQIVALRGLEEGGYTWGGGWRATEGEVIGASIADADGDRINDLSVGSSGGGSGVVTVFGHDGAWRFDSYPELFVNTELYSIQVGDETSDGRPDVSIFATVTGTVRRYTLADEGWVGAQTSELPGYESLDGGTLLPQADIDGDGVLETIISGSPDANSQELVFFVIDPGGQGSVNYPNSFGVYDATVADLALDGTPDIIVSEDDHLTILSWDGEKFESRKSEGTGAHGPVVGVDMSQDGLPDVVITSDAVRVHVGEYTENDAWQRNGFDWTSYPTLYERSLQVADVNNDGQADLVGLQVDPDTGDVDVIAWTLSFAGAEPELDPLGTVNLVTSGVGHDLVVCDGDVYALAEGIDDDTGSTSSSIRLSLIRYSDSTGAIVVAERSVDRGSMLDCGIIDNGTVGVAVSSQTGFWATFGDGLTDVGSGDVGATDDIALADTNGDGLGEVIGCTGTDRACSVVAIDIEGDGIDEVMRSYDTTVLTSTSGDTSLAGVGDLRSVDIDGDGRLDVIGWDTEAGMLLAWRNAGTTLAPPVGLHTDRDLVAVAGLADMTGDGVPEMVFVDIDGRTVHSEATIAAAGAAW